MEANNGLQRSALDTAFGAESPRVARTRESPQAGKDGSPSARQLESGAEPRPRLPLVRAKGCRAIARPIPAVSRRREPGVLQTECGATQRHGAPGPGNQHWA